MRNMILLFVLAILSACQATPEQVAEVIRQQVEWDTNKCQGYGFKKGTQQFAACMTQMDMQRTQVQIQQQQNSSIMGLYGLQLMQQSGPRAYPTTGVNCSSRDIGGTIYTNCY